MKDMVFIVEIVAYNTTEYNYLRVLIAFSGSGDWECIFAVICPKFIPWVLCQYHV